MKEDTIKALLQQGERISLECKKAENKLPGSLWETYSAFANTYGGTILLGVIKIEQPELLQVKLQMKIKGYAKNVTKDDINDDINKITDYQQNDTKNDINNVTKNVTKELSKRQLNIVEMIKEDNLVTTFDLSQMLGVTRMTIQRDLKVLRNMGLITRKGGRSNGEWIVL